MSAPPPKTYNAPLIEPKSQPTRYLYRPHDGFELGGCHADVYLPTEEPTKDGGWPVALAIHGGSFAMFGARQVQAPLTTQLSVMPCSSDRAMLMWTFLTITALIRYQPIRSTISLPVASP